MAKKKAARKPVSQITRDRLAGKARQREARKRAVKAAESLRPEDGSVTLSTTGADGKTRSATLHSDGWGSTSDVVDVVESVLADPKAKNLLSPRPSAPTVSRQVSKRIFELREIKAKATVEIFQIEEVIKTTNARFDKIDAEEEAILVAEEEKGSRTTGLTIEASEALTIIHKEKSELRDKVGDLTIRKSSLRSEIKKAVAEVNRLVQGENADGTIFAAAEGGETE